MLSPVPITAIFPAYDRPEEALHTLEVILRCDPTPSEIIVHVDGGAHAVAAAIRDVYPEVLVIVSESHVGPGGARNFLLQAASHELVANFDDDSAPERPDYFARVMQVARLFPDAAVITAASLPEEKTTPGFMRVGIFSGCGFVFRKSCFLKTMGFVPLRVAYCMEEADLSLRLHAQGALIVHDPLLRVVHRKQSPEHVATHLDACILANIALLPLLRYPWYLMPLSLIHVMLRAVQLVRRGAWLGLITGFLRMPLYLLQQFKHRNPVSMNDLLSWLELRRYPECLALINPSPPPSAF